MGTESECFWKSGQRKMASSVLIGRDGRGLLYFRTGGTLEKEGSSKLVKKKSKNREWMGLQATTQKP